MTARDRWTVDLKCPSCGHEGVAKVSQADGWAFERDQSTSLDHLPDGFKRVDTRDGDFDLYCATCDVKATGND